MKYKKRLGEQLLAKQIISQDQLQKAYEVQKQQGGKLGPVLVSLGFIDEQKLAQIMSEQLDIPYYNLKTYEFKPNYTLLLPESYARRYKAIILDQHHDELILAMADPLDIFAYDEIAKILKQKIKLAIATESDLIASIDLVYRHREEISDFAGQLSDALEASEVDLGEFTVDTGSEDAPVVKLLQSLFTDAVNMNASDIHIEPDEQKLRIRQRIDGQLQETMMDEKRIINALTLRLKLMAGLNIAERRLPQDGRFSIKVKGQNIDVRLSTMPIQFGEAVVMRLLNQSRGMLDYNTLGILPTMQEQLRRVVQRPYGMILVTGPTGSGKTTTLYSILDQINVAEKKILTVEDPVEYHLPRINQIQVNSKIDLSFTRILRSALRHDPDIIMIGEIRDEETATIALRASMTGHLVLATLHTNDAASSALRLISMGVDSFLVASALSAILAQRLVRRICSNCIDNCVLEPQEEAWFKTALGEKYHSIIFKKGRGCSHCNLTGYSGRIGVYELLELNREMIMALNDNDAVRYVEAVRSSKSFTPLGLSAVNLAIQGTTTAGEVIRTIGHLTDELSLGIKQQFPSR